MQGNVLIIGGPASGKTYRCRKMVQETLAAGGRVIALDWHGEYSELAEQHPDRLTCIGTGSYDEATPGWLSDQLGKLEALLPADLVVVEGDAYLSEAGVQALLPLACCRVRWAGGQLVLTSQAVRPFTSEAGRQLLAQMGTVVMLRLRGPDSEEAAQLLALRPDQVGLLYRGGSVTISAAG